MVVWADGSLYECVLDLRTEEYLHILTSNENATPQCSSISQWCIEYTFTKDLWWFYEHKRQKQYWLY